MDSGLNPEANTATVVMSAHTIALHFLVFSMYAKSGKSAATTRGLQLIVRLTEQYQSMMHHFVKHPNTMLGGTVNLSAYDGEAVSMVQSLMNITSEVNAGDMPKVLTLFSITIVEDGNKKSKSISATTTWELLQKAKKESFPAPNGIFEWMSLALPGERAVYTDSVGTTEIIGAVELLDKT